MKINRHKLDKEHVGLRGCNLLQTLTMPCNMTLTQSYELQRNLLTSISYRRGSTLVVQRTYTYDLLGRPTARDTARQGNAMNDAFEHNSRSELTFATVNGTDYEYVYDNIGNRETAQETAESATFYESNCLNQYTAIGDFEPTYDDAGNQTKVKTSTGIWSVVYNAENRPTSFTNADSGTIVECSYDYMGRRATKKVTVNGSVTLHQRFLYRGYLQIACCDLTRSNHPCLWLITWDPSQTTVSRPLTIRKDGTWFAYGWDITKNICEIFGPAGYIRSTYTYTPYGCVSESGDVKQTIQWSSEFNDNELGMTYYNYRHYNPMDGRWICRDFPKETTSCNLYAYVFNKPLHFSDYIGLWEIKRSSQSATADAKAECGDTWEDLAKFVGLHVSEATQWVGGYTRTPRKGRTYTVPNTIISYWVGDVGRVGRWWVDWNDNNEAFKKANYHVKNYIADETTSYSSILNGESFAKTLQGTYYWGHGVYDGSGRAVALLERGDNNYAFFEDFYLSYHMQFAFIFACDSIRGKNFIKAIHYRGFEGTLVPWNPWRPIYTEPSDYIE